jgi:signal transduction histidine kinase
MIKAMFLEFLQQRDVTERKMFEKEMIDAKFLQKLLQSQTTVLSNMTTRFAHQKFHFRVYKCVIETGLDLQQFLEAINTSGKSLNLLINDILDLAK